MVTPTNRLGSHPYTLPDLRRRPGQLLSADRQDITVTVPAAVVATSPRRALQLQ